MTVGSTLFPTQSPAAQHTAFQAGASAHESWPRQAAHPAPGALATMEAPTLQASHATAVASSPDRIQSDKRWWGHPEAVRRSQWSADLSLRQAAANVSRPRSSGVRRRTSRRGATHIKHSKGRAVAGIDQSAWTLTAMASVLTAFSGVALRRRHRGGRWEWRAGPVRRLPVAHPRQPRRAVRFLPADHRAFLPLAGQERAARAPALVPGVPPSSRAPNHRSSRRARSSRRRSRSLPHSHSRSRPRNLPPRPRAGAIVRGAPD